MSLRIILYIIIAEPVARNRPTVSAGDTDITFTFRLFL